ncbi:MULTISPECIES: PAAR domain-containing protein [unclassified Enterobacter]|uniref:PAAR domain-containing protein n=1 Tax=unclassified Enterobacter TaxID=2608935 RepID=UPI00292B6726|nr:PAAR domain-containing protein [Enterobacter sp. 23-M-SZ-13]MDV0593492.1 PAAR domain-containing protein [Enterobacter sp. 23-M-SZ-13]
MATGFYLRVGDRTTCGGKILTGTPDIDWNGADAAREGDFVSCGKNPGISYKILGGTEGFMDESRQLAGTLDSISSCPCKAKFIPSIPDCYEKETVSSSRRSGVAAAPPIPAALMPKLSSEPEQHTQAAKKKTGIDAGFAVLPYGGTTEAWQRLLFTENPPAGAKELFATLNGADERYKAGSIMLLVDPEKQDDEQIAHMKAAKARVDAALEPLTIQEANFLHKNKDTIDLFTSRASTAVGIASEAAGKYFENIESILTRIQQAYKNQYITSGSLIGEQFYVERRQLFNELDSVLTDFTRHKLALQDYPDIKRALGLSTSSITHRWNQTGVADIEGYATFIEKAAKYVKMMKTAGYVGIALDGVNRLDKIYEACTVGSDCEKTAYTEVGSFGVGLGTGIGAGALVSSSVSTTVCSVVLGALTIEAAGAGMLACGVIFTGAVGYAGGEAGGKLGEKAGEIIYEVTK